jgi:hypothetical protein
LPHLKLVCTSAILALMRLQQAGQPYVVQCPEGGSSATSSPVGFNTALEHESKFHALRRNYVCRILFEELTLSLYNSLIFVRK